MSRTLSESVKSQIDQLDLVRGRPLVVCDADEVLFQFLVGFEDFLARQGLWLDMVTYDLAGNIKDTQTNEALEAEKVPDLLLRFFESETGKLKPVPGAAAALRQIVDRTQIVVLSNVPEAQHPIRALSLSTHGMPYPLVANEGDKGQTIRYLFERVNSRIFFIDDFPRHLTSARDYVEDCVCINLVMHPMVTPLIDQMDFEHHRAKDWQDVLIVIESELAAMGH